jgi:hypothetical protein
VNIQYIVDHDADWAVAWFDGERHEGHIDDVLNWVAEKVIPVWSMVGLPRGGSGRFPEGDYDTVVATLRAQGRTVYTEGS